MTPAAEGATLVRTIHPTVAARPQSGPAAAVAALGRTLCAHPAAAALFAYGVTLLVWGNGLGFRDYSEYLTSAIIFLEAPTLAAPDHWGLRWPLILPLAASLKLFGLGTVQAILPSLLMGGMVVVLAVRTGEALQDRVAGLAAGLFVGTSPLFGHKIIELRPFAPEVLFVALCYWWVWRGMSRRQTRWFALAGLAAGGAWLTRETAAFLLPALLVAGAFAPGAWRERLRYALAGAGTGLAVFVVELLVYWGYLGDPLYRIRLSLGHGGGKMGTQPFEVPEQPYWADFITYPLTDLLTNSLIFPSMLALLVSCALMGATRWRWNIQALQTRFLLALAIAAISNFVVCAYLLSLEDVFYAIAVPYALCLFAAIAVRQASLSVPWYATVTLVSLPVMLNFLMIDFKDSGIPPSRILAARAGELPYPVITDPDTRERAYIFSRLGVGSGLCPEVAAADGKELVFVTTEPGASPDFEVEDDWVLFGWLQRERQGLLHSMLSRQGLAGPQEDGGTDWTTMPADASHFYLRESGRTEGVPAGLTPLCEQAGDARSGQAQAPQLATRPE